MDLENHKNETTSSLTDILNSMKMDDSTKLNIVNYDFDNVNVVSGQTQLENLSSINKLVNFVQNENLEKNINSFEPEHNYNVVQQVQQVEQVQLLSNDIDRRIGNYLLNELEKKQEYIDELEEAVKFQEKEILELKQKLETLSKLELLGKIKSNMDTKLSNLESDLSSSNHDTQSEISNSQSKTNKVVQVKKPVQQNVQQNIQQTQLQKVVKSEEKSDYPRNNPDLVLRKDTYQKVKSISKEEEEPRYNGIMMLEKPKKEEEEKIKITLDYETETASSTDKMSEIIKQRRRNARF